MKSFIWRVVVIFLVLSILSLSFSYYYFFKRVEPQVSGKVYARGLSETVRVLWDSYGIPHVYAGNRHDLYFVQGFLHAQERLWQMDFIRLLGQGRMSEVIGAKAVNLDVFNRKLNLPIAAQQSFMSLEEDIKADMEAYTDGVNEFIKMNLNRLPAEFFLTRRQPAFWKPADSILLILVNAWILSQNSDEELLSAKLILKLGKEKARDFTSPPFGKTPDRAGNTEREEEISEALKDAWRHIAPVNSGMKELVKLSGLRSSSLASNNWVVSGEKSSSGKPLLAGDPHLPVTLPSIWYEMHLVSPEMNVIGASGPGVPFIINGHNGHVAWNYTNVMADNIDLYLIETHPEQPDMYFYEGQWIPFTVEEAIIKVKGSNDPIRKKIYHTLHGPIISEMEVFDKNRKMVAIRWSGHDINTDVAAFAKLNRARNRYDIIEAARNFGVLSQNLLYADAEGHIGWQVTGKIPWRSKGNGKYPVPGWNGEYVWKGYLPFSWLPALQNPVGGFLATANNKTIDDDYPHVISNTWMAPYRFQRLSQLLTEKEKFLIKDFTRMQSDVYSIPAEGFVRSLRDFSSKNQLVGWAMEQLKKWDYSLRVDSVPALLYESTVRRLKENLLSRELGELKDEYLGSLFALAFPLEDILNKMKKDNLEEWKNLLKSSMAEAVEELERRLGRERSKWTWGSLHRIEMAHPLGHGRILSWVYNLGDFGFPGDENTILAGVFDFLHPFRVMVAPSYRIVVDLSDFDKSISMNTSGQSGHAFNRHYGDMTRDWLEVRYHPLYYSKEEVEKNATSLLIFLPAEAPDS